MPERRSCAHRRTVGEISAAFFTILKTRIAISPASASIGDPGALPGGAQRQAMTEIGNRVETASPAGPQAGRTADGDPCDVLGEMIRRQRKARGITLARLSELTGLSIGHLSQIERDISSPSVKALHDIGRALGVNISWFFDGGEKLTLGERRYVVRA